jgi:hypothetical protein
MTAVGSGPSESSGGEREPLEAIAGQINAAA